jgi:hypothetical protein
MTTVPVRPASSVTVDGAWAFLSSDPAKVVVLWPQGDIYLSEVPVNQPPATGAQGTLVKGGSTARHKPTGPGMGIFIRSVAGSQVKVEYEWQKP